MRHALIALLLLALPAGADELNRHPPTISSGALPTCTSGRDGMIYAWTVAATSTDCSTGSGSATSLCQCDGSTWNSVKASAAGAAGDITDVGDCNTGACFQSETARYALAAPVAGGIASFRALVEADISDLAHTTDTTCNDAGVNCLFAASASEGGSATAADALAANGANCAAGEWASGVDASGAAESCTADDTGTDDQTATEVPYTPTTGGDWDDPDPTEVGGALDDLAAAIAAVAPSLTLGDLTNVTETGEGDGIPLVGDGTGGWEPAAGFAAQTNGTSNTVAVTGLATQATDLATWDADGDGSLTDGGLRIDSAGQLRVGALTGSSVCIGGITTAAVCNASYPGATCIGNGATCNNGNGGTAVGDGATAGGLGVAVGASAGATTQNGGVTAIGYNAQATAITAIAIGYQSSSTFAKSIALGGEATTTAAQQFVVGSASREITDVYLGSGVTDPAPLGVTIHATAPSADAAPGTISIAGADAYASAVTNLDGGNVVLSGGDGVGAGDVGLVEVSSSELLLTPTDAPGTCDAGRKGTIYYDDSLSELCDCDGASGWQQVDGGGAC